MKTIKAIYLSSLFSLIILLSPINAFGQNELDSKWDLTYWNIGGELGAITERNHDHKRPALGGINGSLYFANHLILSASFKYSDNIKAQNGGLLYSPEALAEGGGALSSCQFYDEAPDFFCK